MGDGNRWRVGEKLSSEVKKKECYYEYREMQSFGSKAIAYAAVASQKGRKVGEKSEKKKMNEDENV